MSKARSLAALGNAYDDGALSNRNLIINGAMQVAQRGTTSTFTGMHTVDRFSCDFFDVSITQSKVAITSGGAFDAGFRSALKAEVTSAASTGATYTFLYQQIEAQNVANSGWDCTNPASYITLSFWVRSSISGTFYTDVRTNDGTAYGYTKSFSLSANVWTKVTQTISGNPNLTVADDNGVGLLVGIVPYFGTNLTDPSRAEGWAALGAYTSITPDYAQNWCGTNGNTFEITGVSLEVGDTATPFEHRSYGQELALCQRYYQKSNKDGYYQLPSSSIVQIQRQYLRFSPTMRTAPTMTATKTGGSAATAVGTDGSELDGLWFSFGGNQYDVIYWDWTADAEL